MTIIRQAKENDLPALVPIQQEVQELHRQAFPWRFKSVRNEVLSDFLLSNLRSPDSRLFVADLSGKILGYALVTTKNYNEHDFLKPYRAAYLDQVAVLRSAQRQGIGRDLIAACRAALAELKTNRLELDVWEYPGNATAFFKSLGFSVYNRKMSLELENDG